MEKSEKCLINGGVFTAGAEVCEETRCFVCEEGSWQERFVDRVFGIGP